MLLQPYLLLAIFSSALVCAGCILFFSKFAHVFRLVDKPNDRKNHLGNVPVVGGLSIFLGVTISVTIFYKEAWSLPILAAGSILVMVGMTDDAINLRASIRMPIQVMVAFGMIYFGDMSVESVGNLFGQGAVILLGWSSVLFTVMCSVGVINSINMIDGLDGLSGTIVFLTTIPLAVLSWTAGYETTFLLVCCFQVAVLVFIFFNARIFREKALIFMGDAGSMLFGLLIVWLLIKLSQGDGAVLSPVAAGWIFGLPLVDTVSVMVKRVTSGRSPFDADRNHLHHRLLESGLSVNQTLICMSSIHIIFISLGLLCNSFPMFEPLFFWLFVLIVIVFHYSGRYAVRALGRLVGAQH